jgi:hypothetical protein
VPARSDRIIGCLNATQGYGVTNGNSTLASVLTSKQFFAIRGLPTAFALGDLYGPDSYSGVVNPADPRVINTDTDPNYFTDEWIVVGSLDQDLGKGLSLKLTGNFESVRVDLSQDYTNSIQSRA